MTEDHTERLTAALAGRYRIERKLGEGGMASVYLAQDLKHERRVALKILRPELVAVIGAERFLSEIKTTANLQHPHILPLYDSGSADGYLYYVMPYVDGETLREKLDREKQLGVEESLRIARDVADALDYAHRNGVIHRDIKPANILLHDGRPVVADFGIALAVSAAGGGRMTETGLSLGTPHYMSPEQASADRDLNAKSDVYSLGCVLYEMLAGQPPHTGPTAQAILVHILTEEPRALTALRYTVPPNVAAAVAKAIEQLPADRFESAKAFKDALDDPGFTYQARLHTAVGASAALTAAAGPSRPWQRDRRFLAALGVGGVMAALAAFGWLRPAPELPAAAPVRFTFNTRIDFVGPQKDLAISPDGRFVVYKVPIADRTHPMIEIRPLGELEGSALRGGDGGESPFVSPDGQWVGFVTYQGRTTLEKVSALGGAPVTLATSPSVVLGVSWGDDGKIVFGTAADGLFSVSEGGGDPQALTTPDPAQGESHHAWPSVIPGRGAVVFSIVGQGASDAGGELAALDLKSGEVTKLGVQGWAPHYVATAHLVYGVEDGTVRAVPFDVKSLTVTGDAVPLVEGVATKAGGAVDFDVARDGTLVYVRGTNLASEADQLSLAWVDRSGREEAIDAPPRGYVYPRLSPDGKRLALQVGQGDAQAIWIWDFQASTLSPLSLGEGSFISPVWTRRGDRIAFGDGTNILWKASNNTGSPEVLLDHPGGAGGTGSNPAPYFFAPDGSALVFLDQANADTNDDLVMLPLGQPDPTPVWSLNQPYAERNAELSPDGRWMAYMSRESGSPQVYVRPFPDVQADQVQVSNEVGGRYPLWSRDGRELFYLGNPGGNWRLTSVTVAPDDAGRFAFRDRIVLFDWAYRLGVEGRPYDVAADGRFLVIRDADATSDTGPSADVAVVLNWFGEVRERAGG